MAKPQSKYKAAIEDKIEFFRGKEKHTGTVRWRGIAGVTVFPHTVVIIGSDKKPLAVEWYVQDDEVIRKVTK